MLERIGSSPGQWVPSTPFFGTTLTRLNMTPIAVVPDTGLNMTPIAVVPDTGLNITPIAVVPDIGLNMTPIAVVPDTGLNITPIAVVPDTGLNMTPIAVVPDTGLNMTSIAVVPDTGLNMTPIAVVPDTELNITPIAVVPDTGYVSPGPGANNDQQVPATAEGLKFLRATQDETGQETTADNDGISLRSTQSSAGRFFRTPRQSSPPTPARNVNAKVLHLFSGEDFFD